MKFYRNFFKRAVDVVASGGALLMLSVPLAAVTACLHFDSKIGDYAKAGLPVRYIVEAGV